MTLRGAEDQRIMLSEGELNKSHSALENSKNILKIEVSGVNPETEKLEFTKKQTMEIIRR